MSSQNILKTDSIEELARFWDTHDLTEFEGQLEEVAEPVFVRKESSTVSITLSSEDARTLRQVAEAEGVQESALLGRWIRDRLRKSS